MSARAAAEVFEVDGNFSEVEPTLADEPRALEVISQRTLDSSGYGTAPATLRLMLEEEEQRRAIVRSYIARNLKQGVDYGVIESTSAKGKQFKSKPTLFKPGAEKICSLLRLRAEYEADITTATMAGIPGVFAYICRLIDEQGRVQGEGGGSYTLGEKQGDSVNSAIKLGRKRAKIDAVLGVAALSEFFTQDQSTRDEQPDFDGPQHTDAGYRGEPVRQQQQVSNPPSQEQPQQNFEPMTEGQGKAIWAIGIKTRGLSEQQLDQWTQSLYKTNRTALSKQQAMAFITLLKEDGSQPPAPKPVTPAPIIARMDDGSTIEDLSGTPALTNLPNQKKPEPTPAPNPDAEYLQALKQNVAAVLGKDGLDLGRAEIPTLVALITGKKDVSTRTAEDYQKVLDWAEDPQNNTVEARKWIANPEKYKPRQPAQIGTFNVATGQTEPTAPIPTAPPLTLEQLEKLKAGDDDSWNNLLLDTGS